MSFSVPNIFIEFVSAFKQSDKLCEIGEGKSHCLFTSVLRKENFNKNRILFILKRTRLPFLEAENYLLGSETVMYLDSKNKINFKEEILYRPLISVTTSVSRIRKISRFRKTHR